MESAIDADSSRVRVCSTLSLQTSAEPSQHFLICGFRRDVLQLEWIGLQVIELLGSLRRPFDASGKTVSQILPAICSKAPEGG